MRVKTANKFWGILLIALCFLALTAAGPSSGLAAKAGKADQGTAEEKAVKANAVFDVNKVSDMSDYDPANPVIPTGDTNRFRWIGTGVENNIAP